MEALGGLKPLSDVTDDPARTRILIVEDNLVSVAVLKKKLCDAGFTESDLDTVTSGEEGVDLVTMFFPRFPLFHF